MEFSKIVNFKNWTPTDFTYKYGGEEHTFIAGATYSIPADIAIHFAQHLAERELFTSLNEKDQALPESKVKDYISKCFPGGGVDALTAPLKFERVDIKDTNAEPALPVEENKTETDIQQEEPEEDEDVKDNKPPKFKGGRRPKTKDADYK